MGLLDPSVFEELKDNAEENADVSNPEDEQEDIQQDDSTDQESQEDEQHEEDDDDSEVEPEEKTKKRNGFSKRLKRHERQRDELRREVEYWKSKAESSIHKVEDKEPQREMYPDIESYTKDLAVYHAKKALHEQHTKHQQALEERRKSEKMDRWNTQVEELLDIHPDFHEKIQGASDVPMHEDVLHELLESDHGARIAYHLANNKKLAHEIAKLPVKEAIKRIHKIEARLEDSDSIETEDHKPIQTSKAPKPAKPLNPSASNSTKRIEDMTMKEYDEWRRKGGDIKRRK